jgi:hypothetical protein
MWVGGGGIATCIIINFFAWCRGEGTVLPPSHFVPLDGAVWAHWLVSWVGSRTGLDTLQKGKISCSSWELSYDFLVVIHDNPLYFICPDLLVVVCETSYAIRGVVHAITHSLHYLLINLFIFIWGATSELVQLIKQDHVLTKRKPAVTSFPNM